MRPRTKVVVFDLDGVLLDSNKITSEDFYNLHPDADEMSYKEVLCGNFIEETEKLAASRRLETPEQKEERLNIFRDKKRECAIFENIPELLHELNSCGHTLCLNTSSGDKTCLPPLEHHGLSQLFDFFGTKEVSRKKTEKFKMIKEKYGVEGKDMIFVTDTLGDLREAKVSGVPTIAVTWGIHDRSYFGREQHDNLVAIVDSVAELREKILGKW